MLVVDPARRISVAQIKQHRWMLADPTAARQTLSHSLTEYNSNLGDYSEPVLGIMSTLGINRQKTIEVTERGVLALCERFWETHTVPQGEETPLICCVFFSPVSTEQQL